MKLKLTAILLAACVGVGCSSPTPPHVGTMPERQTGHDYWTSIYMSFTCDQLVRESDELSTWLSTYGMGTTDRNLAEMLGRSDALVEQFKTRCNAG